MSDLQRLRVPHPLVLLTGCVLIAAAASWLLPAGEFDRGVDDATGRSVVVAGTYHEVEPSPVGLFDAIVALPLGMAERADVIFLVFLVGGAFVVVDESGVLGRATASLVRAVRGRGVLVIPFVSVLFCLGGVTMNMAEEIVALVPVLLVLVTRLGFAPVVAVAMSAGAAAVGSAFSPINPFGVLIAQGVAEVQPGSGWAFRTVVLVLAMVLWVGMTMRYAVKTQVAVEDSGTAGHVEPLGSRDSIVLAIVGATFALAAWGLLGRGWDFNQLSGLFFVMGTVVGFIAGLGLAGTADAYVRGFREMAYAALLIGFAGAITVVLEQGRVIDTLVQGIFTPLENLPTLVSAVGMMLAHVAVHVPVPSNSGQAVLTMPLLIPVSDLLELPRQVTILAYQYGGVLCDLVTPTNGALMAILAASGVRYDDWLRYALPLFAGLLALGAVAIATGIAIGLT
jgi:uncharacterized ion transporter superfamily protein YfcC